MKVTSTKVQKAIEALQEDLGQNVDLRTENTRPDLFGNKYVLYVGEGCYLNMQPVNSYKTQKAFCEAVENYLDRGHIWEIFGRYDKCCFM